MARLVSTNPAKDFAVVGEVETSSEDEIIAKVQAARAAAPAWRQLGVTKRIELIKKVVDDFRQHGDKIANLITAETGKTMTESHGEFERYINFAQWYIDNGQAAIADELIDYKDGSTHRVTYEPSGVAVAIAPWNFPFGMAIWGILPNLLVGNTVVFKTSEECPLVGKLIEDVLVKHLPEGVFSEVYGDGEVGDFLTDQDIDFIWFTGSTRTGQHLYRKAAGKFIRCTLEMGGSSPCVVFPGADLKQAAEIICALRFRNAGQVCTSMKRLIVHESIADELVNQLAPIVKAQMVGNPEDKATNIGSLVAQRQVDHIQAQVKDAVQKGAKVAAKAEPQSGAKGAFFAPQLLTNISKEMRVWTEEVFGPVLPVVTFKDEAEAITLANDTPYGLNARVISGDLEQAKRVAAAIDAGQVKLNFENSVGEADPFGGYKLSGIGREHGVHGLRELCQIKVIAHE